MQRHAFECTNMRLRKQLDCKAMQRACSTEVGARYERDMRGQRTICPEAALIVYFP